MGSRKQDSSIARKEANKDVVKASLNNCPSSPRKMRLVADIIRGEQVDKALYILKYSKKDASNKLEKLLLSAMANWQLKTKVLTSKKLTLSLKKSSWIVQDN
jgi:large subunit ribosomal protein L22